MFVNAVAEGLSEKHNKTWNPPLRLAIHTLEALFAVQTLEALHRSFHICALKIAKLGILWYEGAQTTVELAHISPFT